MKELSELSVRNPILLVTSKINSLNSFIPFITSRSLHKAAYVCSSYVVPERPGERRVHGNVGSFLPVLTSCPPIVYGASRLFEGR